MMSKILYLERIVDASVPVRFSEDRYRLEHVISNLLSNNATKFSLENGTIRIYVTAKEGANDEETTAVTVAIKDDGRGISAADQKQLFENFFQPPASAGARIGAGALFLQADSVIARRKNRCGLRGRER